MHIYEDILEMLQNNQKGVLITLMAGTPNFEKYIGKHYLWANDNLSAYKRAIEMNSNDTSMFPELMSDNLQKLAQKVLRERKFYRGRLSFDNEWIDVICEPILTKPRLIIFGCGHVGLALANQANFLELPLIVVDDRPVFANSAHFPEGTKVICTDFSRAVEQIKPLETDFVVIATRGHKYDRVVLEKLSGRDFAYIGMIGSRRRVKDLFLELSKEGIQTGWLDQVHAPIGLDIGAETPAEIAISILAEIIQIWRKGAES